MIRPRDEVALMEGYHSPQVSVDVRLNTNESPTAPPAAWQAAFEKAVQIVDWNRYPDRAATDLRAAIARLHAETRPKLGPRAPRSMAISPGHMLTMSEGMVNGDTLRGPRSASTPSPVS